jgi:hypothetical protein
VSVEGLGDLVGEGLDLRFGAFGVQVDPAVGEVLDIPGHIISTGQTKDLGSETDPLDVSDIPDITMGDMG